jgi:cytochrome c-type biogenesis protein CcmH/NrfG
MTSCILLLYIALSGHSGRCDVVDLTLLPSDERTHPQGGVVAASDPDALYARREDIAAARQAEAIWADRLERNPRDFESAWKLARARYWLGGHAPDRERKSTLEAGVAAGRTAARLEPARPEGHFWMGANMGALAEAHGLRQGLKYRSEIKEALLTVLKLDPAFQQGSADRALGRWYYKVPGLFGGSKTRSEEHLRKSLTYNPNSTSSLFFLAETLVALDRDGEAKAALQRILEVTPDPEWVPEDRDFKEKARQLLQKLR